MIRVLMFACTMLALTATLSVARAAPADAPLAQTTATSLPTMTPTATSIALPDLAVTLVATLSNLSTTQQSIIYNVTVTNGGVGASGATTLVMALPSGTTGYSYIPGCAFDGATYSCPVPALASQQSASYWVIVTATGTQSVIAATATVDPNSLVAESNETNNVATTSTTVTLATATVTLSPTATATSSTLPDLTVSLTGAVSTVSGTQQVVVYTLTVQNLGSGASTTTTAVMPLPYGTTMYSAGGCTFDGYNFTCSIPALTYYQTASFTISVLSTTTLTAITATATVDPSNLVLETSETNNVATTSVSPSSYLGTSACYYNPAACAAGTTPCGYGSTLCNPGATGCTYGTTGCGTSPYNGSTSTGLTNPGYSAPPAPPTSSGSPNGAAPNGSPPPNLNASGGNAIAANPVANPPAAPPPSLSASPPASSAPPAVSVASPVISGPPEAAVPNGDQWLVVFAATQTYGEDDQPLWMAQPGEWYRVAVLQDGSWVLGVYESDPPELLVWIPLSNSVALTLVPTTSAA